MRLALFNPHCHHVVLRNGAHVIALILSVLLVALVISEGMPDPRLVSVTAVITFLCLVDVVVGYVIAWRHESLGAVVSLVGLLLFYAASFAALGAYPAPAFLLFAAPGLMLLAANFVEWMEARHL